MDETDFSFKALPERDLAGKKAKQEVVINLKPNWLLFFC